jgi:catechol 2,3-dioxygenase
MTIFSMEGAPPDAQLTHMGVFVCNLDAMVQFYTTIFGLVVTDKGSNYRNHKVAFLSRNPMEHHQLVLAQGREAGTETTVQQISFEVRELEELRQFHARLVALKVDELIPRSHGNAWSIYFHDPEGNRVEIYLPTPWHVSQPFGEPLDLSDPAEVIRAKTLAMIQSDPTFCPREEWAESLRARLGVN